MKPGVPPPADCPCLLIGAGAQRLQLSGFRVEGLKEKRHFTLCTLANFMLGASEMNKNNLRSVTKIIQWMSSSFLQLQNTWEDLFLAS